MTLQAWRSSVVSRVPGRCVLCLAMIALAAVPACRESSVSAPSGPDIAGDWLGQEPPGDRAVLFAPGVVSTGMFTRDLAVTPDGNEIYFTVMGPGFDFSAILVTRREDGRWTRPEVAPFSGHYRDLEPAVSPDGRQLFFVSYRPDDEKGPPETETDVWVMERMPEGWGPARPVGPPVNTEAEEFFPSVTREGTLYFTRRLADGDEAIYRAPAVDGGYAEPRRLGPEVNAGRARYNAYVAPDDSYLIVPIFGLEDSLGGTDYYASFRQADGSWAGPVHLGDRINSESRQEYSASLSPDGRYLFFMSARAEHAKTRMDPRLTIEKLRRLHDQPENGNPDIYWIDAGFIASLRPREN